MVCGVNDPYGQKKCDEPIWQNLYFENCGEEKRRHNGTCRNVEAEDIEIRVGVQESFQHGTNIRKKEQRRMGIASLSITNVKKD
jgi:hypothetical protein